MIYIYDGSFIGLLTVIFEAKYNNITPIKITTDTNNLFNSITIQTDFEKANKVKKFIIKNTNKLFFEKIYLTFLSEKQDIEIDIYNYIDILIKKNIDKITDYNIFFNKYSKKVSFESHRFKGLIRFSELTTGEFYSRFSPTYNILTLLAPHFKNRFPNENWIIHDIKREYALIYSKQAKQVNHVKILKSFDITEDKYSLSEKEFQTLWKNYFKASSIKERKNLKLQMKFVPKKYWENILEFN